MSCKAMLCYVRLCYLVLCDVVLCYHVDVEGSLQIGLEVALEGLVENTRFAVLLGDKSREGGMIDQKAMVR